MENRYDKYKDSGVEWIGEIPEHWEVKKIGLLYIPRNEKVSDQDYPALSVTMQGVLLQLENVAKTNDGDNRKLVKIGDFAINSRSDRRGSCGISKYDGSVSLINTVLTPIHDMDPVFYEWLFHSSLFSDEYYRWGHGIVNDLWTTKWQEMKNIQIVAPPLQEQQFIANYLDQKCGEIDELITLQEEMITKLQSYKQSVITEAVTKGLDKNAPLKDSGVEWIGKIPEHWIVKRLKYVCDFNPQNDQSISKLSEVGYLPMERLKNGYMLPSVISVSNLTQGLIFFKENDIVLAKVTPCFENGNIAIAKNLVNNCGFGSSELFVFRVKSINRKYLFYLLQEGKIKDACKSTMIGTGGLKRISPIFMKNIQLPIPSLPEQQSISDYLDQKCSEIDELISIKQQKIEKLKEYKKSLIFECVTGKRKVC